MQPTDVCDRFSDFLTNINERSFRLLLRSGNAELRPRTDPKASGDLHSGSKSGSANIMASISFKRARAFFCCYIIELKSTSQLQIALDSITDATETPTSSYNCQEWGVYTIQQTSSKLPANVFKIHVLMLDVCWIV